MINWLKQRWKVNGRNLLLILGAFAVTGLATGYLMNKIPLWLQVSKYSWVWWLLKIGILVFGYQVIILLAGFCFGQFSFFWRYEKKILRRMGLIKNDKPPSQTRIAIFASGTGSNAQRIISHFRDHPTVKVVLIAGNNKQAGIVEIAKKEDLPFLWFDKRRFYDYGYIVELDRYKVDFIVLAGFMWKVPGNIINKYPGKIINIHPALLPKYGGKGMFGSHVHHAVIESKDKESGITIHYVDEIYDHGSIIFQARCPVESGDTAESLADKIHTLEYHHYPTVIEKLIVGGF